MRLGAAVLAGVAALAGAGTLAGQECRGVRPARAAVIGGSVAGAWAAAAVLHPDEWWKGEPRAFRLNWANGASPAAGQDYLLHVAGSYQLSQAAAAAWRWACAGPTAAAWLGAATAFAAGLPKKVVDGFHESGFEVAKNLANAVGAALPVAHARWPATRAVALKVLYWPSAEYRHRAAGAEPTTPLSDYAGQRLYVSVNPARGGVAPRWWPRWLGVAVGHSTTEWVTDPPAGHVWYVALDLEWRGLPVRARWWRPVATVLDQVHLPAPGVRLERGRFAPGAF